jgi:2-keto-4-pentenoate hydratase/2-oxohepta-3-ene-1,7-dioic acid hydratase in catechol pathway
MKLLSYRHRGHDSFGALVGDGIVDLGSRHRSLRAALAEGGAADLAAYVRTRSADIALDGVEQLPVIPDPEKIVCVGLNYESHRSETGRPKTSYPVLFTRFADTQVGNGQPLRKPRESEEFDYEGELAVVIGRRARRVPAADALSVVAGYSCYHDASVRDWQRHTNQFTPGKNFPATGGFGPCLVTTDEIPDPSRLTLATRLNGRELQRATTDLMIFSVQKLIAYITQFTELRPGDVIATGTPGGVGFKREPPVFMRPGDVAEVEISGIGVLRNPVAGDQAG